LSAIRTASLISTSLSPAFLAPGMWYSTHGTQLLASAAPNATRLRSRLLNSLI
jgi:hypothetical protein